MGATPMKLGYDPRPNIAHWRGTPIPPVDNPLQQTPARIDIAARVWWNGPAWTVLRNASHYLWHVMDYGRDQDIRFTLKDVPSELWLEALNAARPGLLSKGAYTLWSLVFECINLEILKDWPTTAHRNDWRPLEHATREELYRRHARSAPQAHVGTRTFELEAQRSAK